jgi:preprotein translocase subunit SecY
MFKILVLLIFAGILASLASGLFYLFRDQEGGSRRTVNALTVRIALSVALFVLLFVAWAAGLIQPHGIAG